ncbi:hypothetical protein MUN78_07665 [Leucobacter allii]|uniref:YtxH domain-containing protein n=1 Tax=Leucobacter allii TaxID=2932247 RepID=A0ABY4FR94_9MICO|nr:hypothetical protein [Leucobacter allii]UOQ58689.1 hypothetical protein MUN78_07665 [Leucobacter allii]UOR03215.1 hypothetical protein MUN77_08010 [Leucobacter allii]
MRRLGWLLTGAALGFVAAHFVNRTPEGRRFFTRVNRGMEEFGRAFASGYEAESDADGFDEDLEAALRDLPDAR